MLAKASNGYVAIDSLFPFGKNRKANIEKILNYQLNRLNEEITQDALDDFSGEVYPEFLIAPAGTTFDDQSLRQNIEIISLSKEIKPKDKVYGVIVLSKETLLLKGVAKKIANEFAKSHADGFCISVENFKCETETTELLLAYRDFFQELSKRQKPIVSLYGGFFDLLLAPFGVTSIVHGIDSGEKLTSITGKGGGRKLKLYYSYKLKMKLNPAFVDFIKSGDKELLQCDCPPCETLSIERNDYLQHFLYCREKEVEEVNNKFNHINQLKTFYTKYSAPLKLVIPIEHRRGGCR